MCCTWINNVFSSQMASPALCWRTGGRWRSSSRQESPFCRTTPVQKSAPTCRSVVSAGSSAARRERNRHTLLSSVVSTTLEGKVLQFFATTVSYTSKNVVRSSTFTLGHRSTQIHPHSIQSEPVHLFSKSKYILIVTTKWRDKWRERKKGFFWLQPQHVDH